MNSVNLLPEQGAYRKLKSYQKAEIIFDGTYHFVHRVFNRYDRTIDQMIQAARSGKQNIAEASMASATSKETELKLTNVARASLEELKLDYEDFIRVRHYTLWNNNHPYFKRLSALNKIPDANYDTFKMGIEHENLEIAANVMHGLICVCSFLLKNQIAALEKIYLKQGGFNERMYQARKKVTK
jgi:four helix bundle suffix protein